MIRSPVVVRYLSVSLKRVLTMNVSYNDYARTHNMRFQLNP